MVLVSLYSVQNKESSFHKLSDMAPKLKILDLSLRLTVVPLSAVTLWLTVTNQQDNSTYVNLKFSDFLGLKYMICISAASAGFALGAALCTWIKCLACKPWVFFALDQIQGSPMVKAMSCIKLLLVAVFRNRISDVGFNSYPVYRKLANSEQIIAYLMVTSVAAVSEILNLAQNGDKEVTWSEACSSYGKFCQKMKLALVFNSLALFCFVFLAAISAYRAFSVFQLPCIASKDEEEERVQGSVD